MRFARRARYGRAKAADDVRRAILCSIADRLNRRLLNRKGCRRYDLRRHAGPILMRRCRKFCRTPTSFPNYDEGWFTGETELDRIGASLLSGAGHVVVKRKDGCHVRSKR